MPILTEDEKKQFFRTTLEQFLRKPEKCISQKGVIQALSQLNVPSDVLIGYLGETLGMSQDGETVQEVSENPISILTSVFILNMASIKAMPEFNNPTEAEQASFDKLLKIVFKINIWIGSN